MLIVIGFLYVYWLWVLGAYGVAGLENIRPYSLKGIPIAIDTFYNLSEEKSLPLEIQKII